jgi:sterol desaturase/sphingolipid hydroxylase (fatty acid hydroxylase superfamily)
MRSSGMNPQEFARTIVGVLAVMAGVALLEAAIPFFARPPTLPDRRKANLALTVVTLLFAFVLTSAVAVAAVYLPFVSPGLMDALALPMAARVLVGIVALDFAYGYAAHWMLHASPTLWRYHRVHHSDAFVDVTTSFRTHPVENAWRHLWLFLTVWLLGVPASAVAAFRVLSAVNGILEHANIRVAPTLDATVSSVWVTPHMHKVHHSREQAETDSNYGNLFTFHDRLFGTFLPTTRASLVTYGLDDVPPAATRSLRALLALPWRGAPLRRTLAVETAR